MKTKTFKTKLAAAMLLMALAFSFPVRAQVTIGAGSEPNPSAVLDLRSNDKYGLLLPRVALTSTTSFAPLLAHVAGMFVYNTATAGDVTPGVYYNDGTKWIRNNAPEWFWLPSFNLDISTTGAKTIDLYNNVYKKQFQKSGNADFVVSAGSVYVTATNQPLYTAAQLAFVVTAYDRSMITVNSISAVGVMSYTVLSTNADPGSYINIVCVVK